MSEEIQEKQKFGVITFIRRIVQFISFLLLNFVILEAIFNTELSIVSEIFKATPFINPAGNAWSEGAGFLEYTMYSITEGTFPFLFLALIGVFALLTGRFACGWICPTGFLQDLFAGLSKKNKQLSVEADHRYKKMKTFVLFIMILLIAPLGYYAVYDPAQYIVYSEAIGELSSNPTGPFSLADFIFVTIPTFIRDIVENMSFTYIFSKDHAWRAVLFFLYLIVISLSITYPRWYCRYLCPYGAISSIFSEYSLLKLQRLPTRCVGRKMCGACERACPMQIRILDEDFGGYTGEGECILCLKCLEACSQKNYNAIKFKFGLN